MPIIGWGHEIEGLGRDDALAYYARFYTPENAILIVAGDVEPEEALRLAEAALRPDPPARRAAGARRRPREPKPVARRLGDGDRRQGRAAGLAARLSLARATPPRRPASPRRSKCSRICSAAARPAFSIARWWSRATRRSRRAPITQARRSTTRGSFSTAMPSAGVSLDRARRGFRRGARELRRRRRGGGRTGARQDPAGRRRRLRAGQPGDARALVRRLARDRADHRRRAGLAGAHRGGDRRGGVARRAHNGWTGAAPSRAS